MLDKWQKKEKPVFTGISRGMGGFSFGAAGGGTDAAASSADYTTVAGLTAGVSWTIWPNGGNYTGNFSSSDYYGSRSEITSGDGRVRHNNYEYSIMTKFNARTDDTKTAVFQIYGYNASESNFNNFDGGTDPGNLWGIGVAWNQVATDMYQTNSIYARSELTSGNGAYFVTGGTGNKTWSFYDGGANSNGNGQSSTNRETSKSVNWAWGSSEADRRMTYIVYASNHPFHAGKVRLFIGETLIHEFTSSPGTNDNVWMFSSYMYPNNQQTKFDAIDMKFRYASTAAIIDI